MRIYISGIVSTELSDIKKSFERDTLIFYSGEDGKKRIEVIESCEAIYLPVGWQRSAVLFREKNVAELLNLKVIYQGQRDADNATIEKVERLKAVIQEVCGLEFSEYAVESRKKNKFFARMIFVRQCKIIGIANKEIADLLGKSKSNIVSCNKKYNVDFEYNKEFRELAENVDGYLNREAIMAKFPKDEIITENLIGKKKNSNHDKRNRRNNTF